MNRHYPNVFEPMTVRDVTFKNRLFASPTALSWHTSDRRPDDNYIRFIERKARGGAAQVTLAGGLIEQELFPDRVFGGAFWSDRRILPRLVELAYVMHQHDCVASLELYHAGAMNPVDKYGRNPVSASAFVREDGQQVDEATPERMKEIAESYARFAALLREAGFDSVMIHGGHGWLLGQFLAKEYNKRTDEFGGGMENRARFPMMVIDAVRDAVGAGMLIEFRLSGDEMTPETGGATQQEMLEFCKLIDDKVDLLHVSAGRDTTNRGRVITHPTIFRANGCNAYLAEEVRKHVSSPVVAIGGINTPELAESILARGGADFVAMGRAFLADPDFARKARKGVSDQINSCVRCLDCLARLNVNDSFDCSVNPTTGHELTNSWIQPAAEKLKVVVVGGGIAGCKAAATAAERGHDVVLLEKEEALGGILRFTFDNDLKVDLRRQIQHQIAEVGRLGVDVRLNTEATSELIDGLAPNAVIVATGSEPNRPNIPGLAEHAMHVLDMHGAKPQLGQAIVVVGGGLAGCEAAVELARQGKEVTVVEGGPEPATDANFIQRDGLMVALKESGVDVRTGTQCVSVSEEGVMVRDVVAGNERLIPADDVVYAVGMHAVDDLVGKLAGFDGDVIAVGDCRRPRNIKAAIREGYFSAIDLA